MDRAERIDTMFSYYQEITLIPDADLSSAFLWTKVFTQLHIALADSIHTKKSMPFAAGFPEYDEKGLGIKLRIFSGNRENLETLQIGNWMARLSDYVHMTSIRKVPEGRIKGYAVYSRVQPDASIARKARRYVKRHEGVTIEEAAALLKTKAPESHLPYIQIRSASTGERFSLFIRRQSLESPQPGDFNAYGLSTAGTVPEF